MDSALKAASPLLSPLCSTSQISQSIRANHLENDRVQNGIEKVVRPLVRSFSVNPLSVHLFYESWTTLLLNPYLTKG